MSTKRLLSLIICVIMMATLVIVPATSANAADADTAPTANNVVGYNLPADVHDGNILHAFSWKLKEVTQYAQEIAEAGYTAVQVSPIQCTKDTTNDGAFANDWWCFYQPTDLAIGNELGDADDLKEMCNTLHSYGIKVICDVVANHVQNSTNKTEASKVNATLKSYLRNTSGTKLVPYVDSTRAGQTTTDLNSQLPDLDTSNKDYQNYLINYLDTLADCGVDGFRFDAAKHIETPDDGAVASDFWPTITDAILDKNPDAYIYGEVLGLNGLLPITAYTKYIDVTDFAYGSVVRNAIKTKKAPASLANYGFTGSQKADNVLWLESHDTFTTNPSNSDSSNFLNIDQQIAGWAVVGARKDAPALYLVRTNCAELDVTPTLVSIKYDELIGAPGAADTWKSPAVKAVNQFKNEFVGQSENVSTNGSLFFVQRGTTGMVISNLATGSTTVNQACTMANGTYTDQVSGNKFTVSGGKISGTVGESGVAVVYNPKKAAPIAKVKLNSTVLGADTLNSYTGSTATIAVTLENATKGTVKVGNLPALEVLADGAAITLNSSIKVGSGINVTVTATNGTQTTTNTYKILKKNASETKRVYFDNTVTQWPKVHVYCKTGENRSTEIVDFPGYAMTQDATNPNLYYYDVPATTNYVKFSEGAVAAHIGHSASVCGGYCGRTMPPTVIYYGTANSAANRESGGYKLTGSMIFEKLEWKDYGEYPVVTLSNSDVTYSTEIPTEPSTSKPTYEAGTLIYGDLTLDGKVSILDATAIQRHQAEIALIDSEILVCGNVDGDDKVTIMDATAIQRQLAEIEIYPLIGTPVETEPETQPTVPVETVTLTLNDTDAFNGKDIYAFAYDGAGSTNGEWPGQKMTKNGSVYTLDVDKAFTKVKFVGVYSEITETTTPVTIETVPFDVKTSAYTLESITLTCKEKWSVACVHLWNTDTVENVSTTWPGIRMNGSSGNFTFNIPKDSPYTQYKFNNNNAGAESNTYYLVEPETTAVYFTNIYGWNNVYFHAWQTGGGGTAWPGLEMEKVETNAQGQDVYKIDVPLNTYNNCIFNNKGAGIQTATLQLQGIPNEGFYPLSGTGQNIQCETYVYGE